MSRLTQILRGFPRLSWDVAKAWYHGGIGDLAAGVTFWILITIPAAVLTLVSSLSFFGDSLTSEVENEVTNFVGRVFTDTEGSIVFAVERLFRQENPGVFTLAAGVTLFTISRGFAGLIRALDTVYDVEDGRTWYHARFVGLILGLGSVLVVVPLLLMEVFVWDRLDLPFETTLRAAFALVVLILWASAIFHWGPATRSNFKWDLPGAIVAAIFWWGLSVGFARYVEIVVRRGGGTDVLGFIGGTLLALTWIWMAAQVLLIGAAVNFVLGEMVGLSRGRRRSKINAAISTATGELRRVVVHSRGEDETLEFHPKAVMERLKSTTRARSAPVDLSDPIGPREPQHVG